MMAQSTAIQQPLPSQSSAAALVRGDLTALPTVALHLLGRGAIISVAVALFGIERDVVKLAKIGLAGSAGIEGFVLLHELTHRQ